MLKPKAPRPKLGRVFSRAIGTGAAAGFIIGSVLLAAATAAASIDPQDAEFLKSVNNSITEYDGQPGSRASSACNRIVASVIDMDAVIQRASGQVLGHVSQRQHAAFRAAARRWAVRECLRQNQDNDGSPLEFLGVRKREDGDRLLATRTLKPAHTIIWLLHGGGKARAMDVVIDGRSMILSLRDETRTLLDRNNGDIDIVTEMLGR